MTDLISLNDIRLTVAGKKILNINSLTIPAHQCTLITGRNGSGKTTLFKVISGLLKPDHTTIEYQGLSIPWKKAKPTLQKDFIYLHQTPYLFDNTVLNNIAYGLYRAGYRQAPAYQKVIQALDWANLSHLAHRSAKQLSGGEKQLVALTRARILSPRLLLLDEPTASMDTHAKQQTSELLERLKSEGTSILICSHETHTVDHIADYYLHLEKGELMPVTTSKITSKICVLNPSKKSR